MEKQNIAGVEGIGGGEMGLNRLKKMKKDLKNKAPFHFFPVGLADYIIDPNATFFLAFGQQ